MNIMSIKVAVAQMNCNLGKARRNLQRLATLARKIGKKEADIVCFPELVTTGYSLYARWRDLAEPIPGPSTEQLSRISREFGFYLIAGMPERDAASGNIFNSAVLLSPEGEVEGVYRKVHLWDKERIHFSPGKEFPVFRTQFGIIGVGICYDLEFPESSRAMALKGAELLFFPSAEMKPMERHVDIYLRSRAAENCVFAAFSNRIGREGKTVFFGRSQIVSPTCRTLARITGSEGFAVATINLLSLAKERRFLPYLEQRVPSAYEMPQLAQIG